MSPSAGIPAGCSLDISSAIVNFPPDSPSPPSRYPERCAVRFSFILRIQKSTWPWRPVSSHRAGGGAGWVSFHQLDDDNKSINKSTTCNVVVPPPPPPPFSFLIWGEYPLQSQLSGRVFVPPQLEPGSHCIQRGWCTGNQWLSMRRKWLCRRARRQYHEHPFPTVSCLCSTEFGNKSPLLLPFSAVPYSDSSHQDGNCSHF